MTPDSTWWWRLAAFLTAQTALLVGAAALFSYKIRAPKTRRAVWQAALIALACVWLGECAGLGEKVRGLWPRERVGIVQPGNPFALVTESPATTGAVKPPSPVHREAPATPVTWPGEVWLLGTMLLLLRAVAMRAWLAWQRRQMGLADVGTQETVARLRAALGLRGVETRTWVRLRGPIAFGWWRPTVAVPAGFSLRFTSGQREAMFAHELAHLAGRDPLWLTLADTVCALAWWNPPAWWAARQLRDASEAVADEASALVPSGPSALAESLLCFGRELAESGLTRRLGITGNGFRSGLGRRVNVLLTFSREMARVAGPGAMVSENSGVGSCIGPDGAADSVRAFRFGLRIAGPIRASPACPPVNKIRGPLRRHFRTGRYGGEQSPPAQAMALRRTNRSSSRLKWPLSWKEARPRPRWTSCSAICRPIRPRGRMPWRNSSTRPKLRTRTISAWIISSPKTRRPLSPPRSLKRPSHPSRGKEIATWRRCPK